MKGSLHASIIVPVYHDWAGLQRCLDALAQQSYPEEYFEVLVIQNDQTSVPLDLRATPNTVVLQEEKIGSYAARNRGIRAAKGRMLAFTDSDCVPDRTWLEKGVAMLQEAKGATAVGGKIRMFIPPGNARSPSALYELCFSFRQQRNVEYRGFSVTANLFVSKSLLQTVGMFRTDVLSGGDVEWCARARQKNVRLKYCPEAIVYHPVRKDWRALRTKVLRVADGVSDARYRSAVKSGRSLKSVIFAKVAATRRIVRARELRTWKEGVIVLFMALLVSVWGIEGRVRSRLRKQNLR